MTIPSELRELVFQSVKLLGVAIQDIYGEELFERIEVLRLKMKGVRNKHPDTVKKALEEVYLNLGRASDEDLHRINKAFVLMLEIINACEAAYRTFRLDNRSISSSSAPDSLVYVFTSHPTEARSKEFLFLTDRVEDLLIEALEQNFYAVSKELHHLFQMALRITLANNKRPDVKDEAQQILHTIMDDRILGEQIILKEHGLNVFFRTWVGGDKDGHPKVGASTLLQTLTLSRHKILDFTEKRLNDFHRELKLFDLDESEITSLLSDLQKNLRGLRKISNGDGLRVQLFKDWFHQLLDLTDDAKVTSPGILDLKNLFKLYPGLVLPMEIREDSSLIHLSLKRPGPIAKMLKTVRLISKGIDPRFYVRGFIISMCQAPEDLMAAIELTKKQFGHYAIPAVPLFENEQGLKNGVRILESAFKKYSMASEHKQKWEGRLEVMLGYSDSSKENGVLPSRMLVEKALLDLEKLLFKHKLVPVFFHGSGGSTGRGGGSLKEQIAWWPHSALNIYKMTIQGETIQRHFHHAPILRSQVNKIVDEFAKHKVQKFYRPQVASDFAELIQVSYRQLVNDPDFQLMTSEATPYDFLNLLKIGSRPTKRTGKGKFTLRAIPWILCWTQTRLLLPIWWGVGEAWSKLSKSEKKELIQYYKNSPLMQSYIKNLGFTLARIEMGVWEFHLSHSRLNDDDKTKWQIRIRKEFEETVLFFHEISGEKNFTWFQTRLGESIIFRSSMIHPLNVIQKISLERKDHVLLRETVTGIACGMLTTG